MRFQRPGELGLLRERREPLALTNVMSHRPTQEIVHALVREPSEEVLRKSAELFVRRYFRERLLDVVGSRTKEALRLSIVKVLRCHFCTGN